MGLQKDEERQQMEEDNKKPFGLIGGENKPVASSQNQGLTPKKATPSTSCLGKSPRRKKKTGVRAARRNENTNFLFTLLDEEYSVKDPEITDFISSHQSAFEQLFLQQEQMEIWSEFMNRSEEEQDRFLREVEEGMFQVAKKASGQRAAVQDKNGNPFSEVEPPAKEEKPTEVVDQRKDNPAHTPQECFKRISTRLQTMLRRRHLPKGAVEGHEEELLEWFGDDPSSVFISSLPSSFDRLLLHAVCQYLDLSSESFDCEGQRQTRVENNNEFFRPPSMLLSAYLDSLR